MTSAEKYVTAAYLVVLAVVLAYVVIYAFKLKRLDREVRRLEEERRAAGEPDRRPEVVEVGRR
jgi:CcmD family protein